ncbi:MAG: TonB-dependent receptor [Candidatus Azobacteroides sp.]|nr:TonB-dependent receptor [Candidatus Azobacteroides sp.]
MHLKREFSGKVFTFRIFKSMRNYILPVICSLFPLTLSATTDSSEMTTAQQQTVKISGTVTDPSGETLIGASVIEKGTSNGTATEENGAFTLNVTPDATVEVNYLGFLPYTFKVVSGRNVYDVQLREDSKSLEEVVVIGYGVQKKKLVTGATVSVGGDDVRKMSTTNIFAAIQNQTPGVSIIQNNGQPGSDYIINIRGLGTNGESRPLYIVDGVPSGNNALNSMSPADIETIDILKDAASAAIYGARAANGVILVTTKQGKAGKTRISYDGSYGWQYMAKKPDMLNAKEYMAVQDEIRFNQNSAPTDWQSLLPQTLYNNIMSGAWTGTDWVNAFYCKGAPIQNHSFNLTGGNEMSKFSMGYSYTSQDGILGEAVQSHYNRHTVRINSDHVVLKVKDFDAIKIGETLNYIYNTNNGLSTGGIYYNAFHNVLIGNPMMPAYDADGNYYDYYDKQNDGWNYDGNFANPIAQAAHSSQGLNLSKNHNLNASAYLQIQPIKNLIFKSQYGYRMNAYSYRSQDQIVYLSNNVNTTTETINQNQSVGYNWTLENTLTYSFSTNDHNVNVMVGQSVEKAGYGEHVASMGKNNIFDLGWKYGWVSNTQPIQLTDVMPDLETVSWGTRDTRGYPLDFSALASFFGRISYNYKETYMATFSLRSDGSSNFTRGRRWGTFPAASAGWVMTNESFMEGARGVLDFLKIRASWGQNGNQNVDPFQYLNTFLFLAQNQYYFGTDKKTPSTGATPGVLQNPDITWETQEQTNAGLDARFLNSRLGVTFDYYTRTTKNWLLKAPINGAWGFDPPNVSGGNVQNKGVELAFTWNDRINDFYYGIGLNGSYDKNKVTKIANPEKIIHGVPDILSQGTDEFYRLQEGYPMGFFFGYKADGIFQNWEEVNAYKNADGSLIMPNAQPGDVRFTDVNGDGQITPADRTMIGCGWPKYKMGFSLNLAYKGFDFLVSAAGAFGFQIAKSYRSFADSPNQNYTTDVFKRWTGEGTSNKWPRLTDGSNINYQQVSDIFLENGNYVKIQNVTLGYDFKRLFRQMPLGQARLYFTAQNLFTITGYSGTDPEIGSNGGADNTPWVSGIDVGYYPAARTYLVGLNLTF